LADVVRWQADHDISVRPGGFPVGRHTAQVLDRRQQSTLSGVVSCVEVFSSDLLRDLRPEVGEDEVRDWMKRKKAWHRHLQVAFGDLPTWPALHGFVEARNAIQHGLGSLTNSQLGVMAGKPRDYTHREETLSLLRMAKVSLDADRVIVGHEDVIRCVNTASAFVRDLDAKAYTAQLRLPAN
jgi:hypothetical protein